MRAGIAAMTWSEELTSSLPKTGSDSVIAADPVLIDIKRFRDLTGLPRDHVYSSIQIGQLKAVKVGRKWLIPRSEVLDYPQRLVSDRVSSRQGRRRTRRSRSRSE